MDQVDATGHQVCAVKFYHNNIKDYFCCEYIWINLVRIYKNLPQNDMEREAWFISNFQEMFQYSVFMKNSSQEARSMPVRFLESKIVYFIKNNIHTDFICQELKIHYFTHFFGKMLQTGIIHHYEYTGQENILDMMACIYAAVLSI